MRLVLCQIVGNLFPQLPLQAHDFEAYQEMLAAKAGLSGAPAAGERYEQISKFLAGGCWGCH